MTMIESLRQAEAEARATIYYIEAADRGWDHRAYGAALNKLRHIREDMKELQERGMA